MDDTSEAVELAGARLQAVAVDLTKQEALFDARVEEVLDCRASTREPRAEQRRRAVSLALRIRRRLRHLRDDVTSVALTLEETFRELAKLRVEKRCWRESLEELRAENAELRTHTDRVRQQAHHAADDAAQLLREMWELRRDREGFREAAERARVETQLAQDVLRRKTEELQELETRLRRAQQDTEDMAYMLTWSRKNGSEAK